MARSSASKCVPSVRCVKRQGPTLSMTRAMRSSARRRWASARRRSEAEVVEEVEVVEVIEVIEGRSSRCRTARGGSTVPLDHLDILDDLDNLWRHSCACHRQPRTGFTDMNRLFAALGAGWGAKKLGGGCFTPVLIFLLLYWLLRGI